MSRLHKFLHIFTSGTHRDNLTMFTGHAPGEAFAACPDDVAAEICVDARLDERDIGLSEGRTRRVEGAEP